MSEPMTADRPTTVAEAVNAHDHWTREHPAEWAAIQMAADLKWGLAQDRPCNFGNCSVTFDPLTGQILGGLGPVGCACENTPRWAAEHQEQMYRPAIPALPRGRHGSRVARSRRRHANIHPSGFMRWAVKEENRNDR